MTVSLLSLSRYAASAVALVALVLLSDGALRSQAKKAEPEKPVAEMLKPAPRPKKPALAASKLPLVFASGERIAFVGNTTAERMSLYGHFETMLHLRFKDKALVVRNFGFPADEVGQRQRSADYTHLDDPLYAFNPDTFLCFFGWNESFKGPEGIETFKKQYEKFLDDYTAKYPRDDAKSKPRFVLVSPIAFDFDAFPRIPRQQLEFQFARLNARVVENPRRELNERLAAGANRFDAFALFRVERRAEEQIREANDAVQRRAHLVAHRGEELALRLIARLREVARLAQLGLLALDPGHVVEHRDETRKCAAAILDRSDDAAHWIGRAVFAAV